MPSTGIELPPQAATGAYPLRLETLRYGTVAEIVHFGPYETETPTIERLLSYIADQGYSVAGPHEEEYIRGPGLPLRSPRRYITIIRYQVTRTP